MTGVVCYLERDWSGVGIRGVRLVGPGAARRWTAPPPRDEAATAESSAADAVSHIVAAADWIASVLRGSSSPVSAATSNSSRPSLDLLCLDVAGTVCVWVTSPGESTPVVTAALAASRLGAGGAPDAARSNWPDLALGIGIERSVQALADRPPARPPRPPRTPRMSKSDPASAKPRPKAEPAPAPRIAVLSALDAEARVLVDELDSRGISVASVCTLWHALVQAWDRAPANSSHSPGADTSPHASNGSAAVIDAAPPALTTAVVAADPRGRVCWAWSERGALLAAGSVRVPASRESDESVSSQAGDASPDSAAPGRREPAAGGQAPDNAGTERHDRWRIADTAGAAARICADWLSWGAELGRAPSRVICVSAPSDADDQGASLAAEIASAWRTATTDAICVEDPVEATLRTLADPLAPGSPALLAPAPSLTGARALLDLSTRPVRAHRRMYRWTAAAIAAAAGVVVVLGWRVNSTVSDAYSRARDLESARGALLDSVADQIPDIRSQLIPEQAISAKIAEVQKRAAQVVDEKPVLPELDRLVAAIEDTGGILITRINLSGSVAPGGLASQSSATVAVPDAETHPRLLDALERSAELLPPGRDYISWTGTLRSTSSGGARPPGETEPRREFALAGTWTTRPPATNSTPASSPQPAPASSGTGAGQEGRP